MEDYIERYFAGTLTKIEKIEFEKKLREDSSLVRDVADYIQLKQALKQELLEIRHAEWQQRKPLKKLNSQWFFRVAAVLAVIIGACWYWLHSSSPTLNDYAHTYINENFEQRNIHMNASKDSMQLAIAHFNKGEFKQSVEITDKLLKAQPENAEVLELNGITYLRLEEYEKALTTFKQMEGLDLYDNPSVFYQAITLLKRKESSDTQEAQKLLQRVVDENLGEKKTAQEWLHN